MNKKYSDYNSTDMVRIDVKKFMAENEILEQISLNNSSESRKNLYDILQTLMESPLTFGDYIYRYIFEKKEFREYLTENSILLDRLNDYSSVPEDIYYSYIEFSFRKNQISGKGSGTMKKDGKKDLSETKEALHNLASDTNRELVFLYSFGLNTSAEITSGWLTKALLQKDFDIKNPTELIYFFALKHGKGREWVYKKIDDINEICVAYHEEDCNFLKASRLIENDTDFAKADILEKLKINDEDGLDQYLYEMKERAIQHSGRTCSAIFERLLNEVSLDRLRNLVQLSECPYDTCDPTNDIIEVIEIKNTKRTKLLRFLKDTISSINVNESNMKLPSKDVAIRLFSGVRWTKNTLDKKINLNPSGAPTNRKDLLIALFLNIIVPYMDNKNAGSESFDLRGDVYEFLDEIDIYLNDANMHGFYERSPFDIFLLLCLYQPNPLSYFLCTWALADPETIVG